MPDSKTVLIAAAGTGGHVFPALAVAEILQSYACKIVWLGTPVGLENRVLLDKPFQLIHLPSRGALGKSFVAKLKSIFFLWLSARKVRRLIKQVKPCAVIGFGGYITLPAGMAAKRCKVPLYLHEQNTVPSLSNRLLAKTAQKVFCGLPCRFKGVTPQLVGNPVRADIAKIEKIYDDKSELHVLVIGGSLGAQVFNQIIPEVAKRLQANKEIIIWLQTGLRQFEQVKAKVDASGLPMRISAFIDDMPQAYQWADLLICRAGALTVSEVMAVGLAALFVPYPHATHQHQLANAKLLADQDAAFLLQQDAFTLDAVCQLLANTQKTALKSMAARAKGYYIAGAADKLAQAVLHNRAASHTI